MVPTARIYSTQFEFWSPQLHQHLHLHSTCHLNIVNNKTHPLTPDLHCHQYLHLCILYRLTGFTQPLHVVKSKYVKHNAFDISVISTLLTLYVYELRATGYWFIICTALQTKPKILQYHAIPPLLSLFV